MEGSASDFSFPRQQPDRFEGRAETVLPYVSFQLVAEIIQEDLAVMLGCGFEHFLRSTVLF